MGKTIEVAVDRAYDQTKTVLPAEVARGTYTVSYTHLTLPTNREV